VRAFIFVLAFLSPVACASGLASVDVAGLQESAKLNALANAELDSGGAPRAYERAAFCAVAGVLRRADASVPDGGITCQQ
jgi:hypothetical protein